MMYENFSPIEKRLYTMYGNEFLICHSITNQLGTSLRETSMHQLFDVVFHFKQKPFRVKELAHFLNVTSARASQILGQLLDVGCVQKDKTGAYCFSITSTVSD